MKLKIVLLLFLFAFTCSDSGRVFYDAGLATTQEVEDIIFSDHHYVYSASRVNALVRVKYSDVFFYKNKFTKRVIKAAAYPSVFYTPHLFILYCKLLI